MSCAAGNNTTTPSSSQTSSTGSYAADEASNNLLDTSSSSSTTVGGQSSSSTANSSLYYTDIVNAAAAAAASSQSTSGSGNNSSSGIMGGGGPTSLGQTSLHSYVYQSYHPQSYHPNLISVGGSGGGGGGGGGSSGMSSSVLMNTAGSGGPVDEPEFKKIKLTHLHLNKQYLLGAGEHLKHLSRFGNSAATSTSSSSNTESNSSSNNMYAVHKKLEERIGGILCCTVCLDLPRAIIYQCTNGHLMCAGCFAHLLADARLKDEQATCPNCRCEISKSLCSRNLAVEKTLCELPASCSYCNVMYSRNLIDYHQTSECVERPTKCVYERIGCTWEGPYHELDTHSQQCIHPNRPAREILSFLKEKDTEENEEHQSIGHLVNFLSIEKICFNDLQFKQYKTDDITPKLYFETNRFNAFFYQWVLKARINDNEKNPNLSLNRYISYQLILKSKLSSSQPSFDMKFCVLKGPFGEVAIQPCVHTFEFSPSKTETEYIRFNISSSDCNKLLGSKTINFRLFMFQP